MRTCHVAERGCLRPCGWRTGNGGIIEASPADMEGPAFMCHECGDDVCGACSAVVPRLVTIHGPRGGVRRRAIRRVRVCNDCIETVAPAHRGVIRTPNG